MEDIDNSKTYFLNIDEEGVVHLGVLHKTQEECNFVHGHISENQLIKDAPIGHNELIRLGVIGTYCMHGKFIIDGIEWGKLHHDENTLPLPIKQRYDELTNN